MEPTEILAAAREGLTDMSERCARLVEDLADTSIPIPGSEWTVREAAVHLAWGPPRYCRHRDGPVRLVEPRNSTRSSYAARTRSMLADNPETDPKKLAEQIREGYGVLLEVTATAPADQPIAYYAGLRPNVADLASQNCSASPSSTATTSPPPRACRGRSIPGMRRWSSVATSGCIPSLMFQPARRRPRGDLPRRGGGNRPAPRPDRRREPTPVEASLPSVDCVISPTR